MIENYFDIYKEELELIDTQNRVELDLYSIIAYIIRTAKSSQHISLRDVSGRRETDFSRVFMGDSGFPDFVVRSREKSNTAKIFGAVEIKYLSENLDEDQLRELSTALLASSAPTTGATSTPSALKAKTESLSPTTPIFLYITITQPFSNYFLSNIIKLTNHYNSNDFNFCFLSINI